MGCGSRDSLLQRLDLAEPLSPKEPENNKLASPKKRMRFVSHPSVDVVVTRWFVRCLNMGHSKLLIRVKSLLTWLIQLPSRGWQLSYTCIGPRITLDEFSARMIVCNDCQSMQIRLVRKHPFQKFYCGSCRCPQWRFAQLVFKNHLRRWQCPLNKHERLNDPPEWKDIIKVEREWTKEPEDEDENVDAERGVDPLRRDPSRRTKVEPAKQGGI